MKNYEIAALVSLSDADYLAAIEKMRASKHLSHQMAERLDDLRELVRTAKRCGHEHMLTQKGIDSDEPGNRPINPIHKEQPILGGRMKKRVCPESEKNYFVVRSFTQEDIENIKLMLRFLNLFEKRGSNLEEIEDLDFRKWVEEHGIPLQKRRAESGMKGEELGFHLNL